jgi:hypothetical protein
MGGWKTFNPLAGSSARCCSDSWMTMVCSITFGLSSGIQPPVTDDLASPQGRKELNRLGTVFVRSAPINGPQ